MATKNLGRAKKEGPKREILVQSFIDKDTWEAIRSLMLAHKMEGRYCSMAYLVYDLLKKEAKKAK